MNAYVPLGQTAAPSSISPTRRVLLEERAADRADCLAEALAAQDRFHDQISAGFEKIDTIGADWAGKCSEPGYDPGMDRINATRRANWLVRVALRNIEAALEEMESA